ncbi:MAG: BON domain-containing protein [Methylovulum sp.]|uniref:BON domain-containing protein n=1 Tax=Methylovulum sp. TaxID=1916980 RepID=UPI002621090A|nr:BON domain-containing protein [Methylovulum sp.]MDD2723946.1 BON domain-containing protein [Methylovulum sp.]
MKQLLLLFAALSALNGCTTTPINEVELASELAQGRRSRVAIITDQAIEADSYDELISDKELQELTHINVHAFNGAALVTGEAPTEALRTKIIGIIRLVDNVKLVHNKIAIAYPSDLHSRASDAELADNIRAALDKIRTLQGFNPAMVKAYVENGMVYLMGKVHRNEGTVAINLIRYQPHVKQIVTVFEYLD